jgi:glycosyltransferase involved in cell wall biosynthesis
MLELLRGVHQRQRPRVPSPFVCATARPFLCARGRVQGIRARTVDRINSREAGIADASRVRLLILANAFPAPGRPAYGSYVARGAEELAAQGNDVRVVALGPGRRGRLATPLAYAGLGARSTAKALLWRPQVILSHFLVPTGTIARRAASLARVPYVLVAHGTDVANAESDPRIRAATRATVADAAAVVCVSRSLGDRLETITGALGPRLQIISAGVDTARFHPGDREVAAAALGWDATGPRVCQLGNLVEVKNPVRLLEAFAELRPSQPAAALAFVGDGPLRDAIAARACALGLSGAVTLAGEVPMDEVARWLRAAHVCTLPSLREGFGLAVVEALACATPVAVSTAAGASSVVREGVTGTLLDPLDVSSIAAAIARAAELEPGAAAVASVSPYSLAREMKRLAEVLADVVGR